MEPLDINRSSLENNEIPQYAAGDYPVQDGHPLVYASLLNHANYFLEQKSRMPGYIEERGRPVRQQWFVTHEVNIHEALNCFVGLAPKSTTINKLAELSFVHVYIHSTLLLLCPATGQYHHLNCMQCACVLYSSTM